MKKIIILLLIAVLFSCKTKERIIEKVVYQKDSTEIVELKRQLNVKEVQLSDYSGQLKLSEQKTLNLIEKLNISENEKQNLKESFETTVKEYNDKGVLIKESYSKKTSELLKDLTKIQEQNNQLSAVLSVTQEANEALKQNYHKVSAERTELSDKVKFIEKENADLKRIKTVSGFSVWFIWSALIAGIAIGIFISVYIKRIISKIKVLI